MAYLRWELIYRLNEEAGLCSSAERSRASLPRQLPHICLRVLSPWDTVTRDWFDMRGAVGNDGVPFGRKGKPWLDLVNRSFLPFPHVANGTKLLESNEPEEEVLDDCLVSSFYRSGN